MELFTDLGNRNLVIIRINPDKYKENEQKINGCFKFDKNNSIKCLTNEFNKRFDILCEKVKYHMENKPKKELTIEKLFFNLSV